MFGANCWFIMQILGIMSPKNRNAVIKAFNRRLTDEDSDKEHSDGSNKVHNVWIDPEAQVSQTRERGTQTSMQVESISYSDEEGCKDGSELEDTPQDRGAAQSSIVSSISDTDPQYRSYLQIWVGA